MNKQKTILFFKISLAMLICLTIFAVNAQASTAGTFPVTESCGMNEEELESVLKYELKPYAAEFLQAEEDYQINALFLVSISALESGWGRYQFRENNIFGYGKMNFENVPNCINFVAWRLRTDYIKEDGKYFNGATVEGIAKCYCNKEWAALIKDIWESLKIEKI